MHCYYVLRVCIIPPCSGVDDNMILIQTGSHFGYNTAQQPPFAVGGGGTELTVAVAATGTGTGTVAVDGG